MSVTDVTSTAAYTSTSAASSTSSSNSVISSDFETFLTMLTVQLENQDPLNPVESTDYAVQLATFSGVEQQVLTNDLLEGLQTQLSVMSMSDLVGWVGMEARAVLPAHFSMEPVEVIVDPEAGATSAYMVVRDKNGNQVDRFEVSTLDDSTEWAGLDASGNLMDEGDYTFHLQSYGTDGILAEEQMPVFSEIVEARAENGQTVLVLASGDEITADEVDALRAPEN